MPVPVSRSEPSVSPPASGFIGWLQSSMGLSEAELHTKLRGNILHVLCETQAPIHQSTVLLHLVRALLEAGQDSLLKQSYPQVYQLYIYSRLTGQPTPDWTAPIYLNRLERHLAQLVLENQDEEDIRATKTLLQQYSELQPDAFHSGEGGSGAIVLSNLSLARQGDPEAIAWYLSETLSALDVGVLVSIKAIPGTAHLRRLAVTVDEHTLAPEVDGAAPQKAGLVHESNAANGPPAPELEGDTKIPRLWILCEATYSPDPSLIARPTAERLRQLQLTQFKDAVLLLQVRGERRPDWSLRIDLTPPEEMLREWARWGDTDALQRLTTMAMASRHVVVEAELANGTLHLICRPASVEETLHGDVLADQDDIVSTLATTLEALAPQGIPRAVIYGQSVDQSEPSWVNYLDLPASAHAALGETPEFLGQTGDLPAIAFLLTRHLNPSLDDLLATGGLRVQLLVRDKLLHVMVDSPVTPYRRLVGPSIKDYLMDLNPVGIQGVRVYGRRSGESLPAWSYGKDFVARSRLVPESTPEFSASDAYVNELLARPDGTMSSTSDVGDLTEAGSDIPELVAWLGNGLARARRGLLRSHLFSSSQVDPVVDNGLEPSTADGIKIAVVWGAVGVLLALQMDWILGQVLSPPTNPALAEPIAATAEGNARQSQAGSDFEQALSELNWPAGENPEQQEDFEAPDGFIAEQNNSQENLVTSPTQPLVAVDSLVEQADFPTFNSQQLNEKLALYNQRLEESGPADIMIVGSSRALRGVDPVALRKELAAMGYENVSIFNFGINGATAQVVDLVIRQVLEPDQLPKLIIWADGARAFNSGRVDVTHNAIVASPGYRDLLTRRVDSDPVTGEGEGTETSSSGGNEANSLPHSYAAMDQWMSDRLAAASSVYDDRDRLKGWLQDRLITAAAPLPDNSGPSEEKLDAPMPEGSIIDFNGFLALSVRFNPATYYQDYARVSGLYDGDYNEFRLNGQQDEALTTLLKFTQQQDIPIVFVNTPLTDEYLDDYRQQAEAEFKKYMLEQSTAQAGFVFRDLGGLWPQRYDYFSDPSHLNRYGAYQVSSQLAQDPMIAWPKSDSAEMP